MAIDSIGMDAVTYTSLLNVYNHCGFTSVGLSGGKSFLQLIYDLNPFFSNIYNSKSLRAFIGYSHFYKVMPEGFIQNTWGRPSDVYGNYTGGKYISEQQDDTAFIVKDVSWRGDRMGYEKYNMYPRSWRKNYGGSVMVNIFYPDAQQHWLNVNIDPYSNGEDIVFRKNEGATRRAYIRVTHQSAGHRGTNISYRSYGYYIKQFSYPGATPGGSAGGSDPDYERPEDVVPPPEQDTLYYEKFWYDSVRYDLPITPSFADPIRLYNIGEQGGSPKTFYFGGADTNMTFSLVSDRQYNGGNDDDYGNPIIKYTGTRQIPQVGVNNAIYKLEVYVPTIGEMKFNQPSGTARILAMKASNGQTIHFRWTKP